MVRGRRRRRNGSFNHYLLRIWFWYIPNSWGGDPEKCPHLFLKTFSNSFNLCRTPLSLDLDALEWIPRVGQQFYLPRNHFCTFPYKLKVKLTIEYLSSDCALYWAVEDVDDVDVGWASGGVIIELILWPPFPPTGEELFEEVDAGRGGCNPGSLIIVARWWFVEAAVADGCCGMIPANTVNTGNLLIIILNN